MSTRRRAAAAFALALALAYAGTATAYHTRFVADNCNYAAPTPASFITRDGSAAVALRARYEGYQWAGGYYPYPTLRWEGNSPGADPLHSPKPPWRA